MAENINNVLRYSVYCEYNTEEVYMAQFNNPDDASVYVREQIKGESKCEQIHDNETHGYHRYNVYDNAQFTEEGGFGDPVMSTDYYWD